MTAFYVFYSYFYHTENAIEASNEEEARRKLTVIEWLQGFHDPVMPWELVDVRSNPRPT